MARKIFVLRKYDIWVIYKVPLDRACRRCLELHGEVFTFDKLPRCSCTEDNDYIGYSPFSAPLIPEMKKEAAEAIAARTRICSRCGVEFFETEYSNDSLCARCSIEAVREITRKNLSDTLQDQQRIWSFLEEHPGATEDEIWDGIGGARKTILKRMVEGGLIIEYRADESSPWKYRCEPAFFDYLACSSCGASLSGSGPGDFLVSRDGAPVCKNCVLDKGWVFC